MGFWSKLRRTVLPGRHNEEVEEEIQFHLAMKERDVGGQRAARIQFGNAARISEETRAAGILDWLESAVRDVRYGFRQLCKAKILTAAVILSLAIGIGSNTAIYSIVDAALIRALPVQDPQSLVILQWSSMGWPEGLLAGHTGDSSGSLVGRFQGSSIAPGTYRKLAHEQTVFRHLIGFSDVDKASAVINGSAEQLSLEFVSANFFEGLGVSPVLGRSFSNDDDRVGQPPVVIISDRLWRNSFGAQRDVLQKHIRVNNVLARIAGVAPPRFFGVQAGSWVDLYAPLAARVTFSRDIFSADGRGDDDQYWWVREIGRLNPSQDVTAATRQLTALFRRVVVPEGLSIASSKIPTLFASPGQRGFDPIGADESRALWILLSLVALLLLIVCANVANLLLVRSVARRREAAVCLALGAPRLRLLRQHLIENLTLGLAGGLAGLALGHLLALGIHQFIISSLEIAGFDLHLDMRILCFTAGLSLLSVLLFGLAPALRTTKTDPNDALKLHGRNVLAGGLRLPRILVSLQVAFSLTMLVAAGLLGRSLLNLKGSNLGFDREHLAYVSVNPWRAGIKQEQINAYVQRLRSALEGIPGVVCVAGIGTRPLSNASSMVTLNFPGKPFSKDGRDSVLFNEVTDGFSKVLGIPLIAGRSFHPQDMRPDPRSVIVDDLFVRKFFPGQNVIGKRFGIGPKPKTLYSVVGVLGSSFYRSLRKGRMPILYRPWIPAERTGSNIIFALRSPLNPTALSAAVRDRVSGVDRSVPVLEFTTQARLIDRTLISERLLSILANSFGAMSLALAAVGLGGLLAYMVALRRGELGIRMALGATPSRIVRLVLKDLFRLAGIGVAIGLPLSFALGRSLRGTLFGVRAADPLTLALAVLLLFMVAVSAASVPARRAARVDPMAVLRDE